MSLIVNADDFGMFDSANRGILYSLENRLINSVSICVNYKSEQALTDILNFRDQLISIGLHVNLTEGYSLVSNSEYLDSLSLYRREMSKDYYFREIEGQIKKFEKVLGFQPEHLDCHQHYAYFDKNAFSAYAELSQSYEIPVRSTYIFSSLERLEKFFLSVEKRYGVNVPFESEKIISTLNSLEVEQRSEVIVLNLEGYDAVREGSLEIVCHPQLMNEGIKNNDLKILESKKIIFPWSSDQ